VVAVGAVVTTGADSSACGAEVGVAGDCPAQADTSRANSVNPKNSFVVKGFILFLFVIVFFFLRQYNWRVLTP
jgi:hypothetical protein